MKIKLSEDFSLPIDVAGEAIGILATRGAGKSGYAPNTGNFNNILGKLVTLELITKPSAGMVRASEILFP